jgi:hypothetical protein
MKYTAFILLTILFSIPLAAQTKPETGIKREVTLYNPYKPSLPDVVKKSFLPDMTDTARVRPDFKYEVRTKPFMPPYTISPIKAATMVPEPLPRLYNSYVNLGFGNHITPLAEISITNQRSKKGNIGLYARHFSTNDNIKLDNGKESYAGYMDNDVSLFGRKLMRKSVFDGSLGYSQKSRYAYGYDTAFTSYDPVKKDIKLTYNRVDAKLGFKSANLDSSDFAYDFRLGYNYFFTRKAFNQHFFGLNGEMAKMWKGFYVGGALEFDFYQPSDSIIDNTSKFIAAVSPFIKKSTENWEVKLGAQILYNKGLTESMWHVYPDIKFGFNIVPSYLSFLAELSGRLEKNEPYEVVDMNPFLLPDRTIFIIQPSDYALVAKAGFTGETGIEGNYNIYASYSVVNNFLTFSNYVYQYGSTIYSRGNYFTPVYDGAEVFNLHGDMAGKINDKFSFEAGADYYRYTLTESDYAWNKPRWDARFGLRYNLRNKILAGAGFNAIGKRVEGVTYLDEMYFVPAYIGKQIDLPYNVTLNLSAEYRYTKILSFWLRFSNISFSKYYEWAYYPSQRFFFMAGFTYSL